MKQAVVAGLSAAFALTIIAGVAGVSYYVGVYKPEAERRAWEEAEKQADIEIEERFDRMYKLERQKHEDLKQLAKDQLKLKEMLRD